MSMEMEFDNTPVTPMVFRGLKHECFDPQCHVRDFIASVEDIDPVSIILRHVTALTEKVETLDSHIAPIIEEVKPAMDQLVNSPMFRMMTGGK